MKIRRTFKKQVLISAIGVFTMAAAGTALAVPLTPTVSSTDGTVYTTSGVFNLASNGFTLAGTLVTVTFASGAQETRTWTGDNAGTGSGSAVGTGWRLSLSGDSNINPWTFVTTGASTDVVGLFLNVRPAKSVFDIVVAPELSPGSSFGSNIRDTNNPNLDSLDGPLGLIVTGVYADALQIGNVSFGDLFLTLDMRFSRTNGAGLSPDRTLSFYTDTDSLASAIELPGNNNGGGTVPEPGVLTLLGIGLAGLAAARRSR